MTNALSFFPHTSFRPNQKETILEIQKLFESDEIENVILESPTGSGKSAIAISLGLYFKSAFLLTSQKILQDQYIKDYSSERVCVLKGRNNYPCKFIPDFTCEDSYCSTKQCPIKSECYYEIAKQRAIESYVALMNYKYFLCITNYTGVFSSRKILICDEAHSLDDECMSFVEFSFSSFYLSKLGVTSKIPVYENLLDYVEWLRMLLEKIKNLKKETQEKLKNKFLDNDKFAEFQKDLENLISQEQKVDTFLQSHDKVEWIFDMTTNEKLRSKTIVFKPLTIGHFAKQLIFKHAEKKLFMSATILDKNSFCRNLDLDPQKTKFIQVPSSFPADIRPIILTRSGNLGKNDIDSSLPNVVKDVGRILDFHDDVRGLIHAHTYKIAHYIKENIEEKYKNRIVLHDSETRAETLKAFLETKEPKVLVTPSMTEGVDLKDDLARFVVIVKLPFMFLGDKQVKRRMEIDPEWYRWKTALTLVQAAGRGVRHEKDFCTIYVMDSQFSYFLKQNRKFFPNYFVEAIKN
jgi:Rad3-related DNA helicase